MLIELGCLQLGDSTPSEFSTTQCLEMVQVFVSLLEHATGHPIDISAGSFSFDVFSLFGNLRESKLCCSMLHFELLEIKNELQFHGI